MDSWMKPSKPSNERACWSPNLIELGKLLISQHDRALRNPRQYVSPLRSVVTLSRTPHWRRTPQDDTAFSTTKPSVPHNYANVKRENHLQLHNRPLGHRGVRLPALQRLQQRLELEIDHKTTSVRFRHAAFSFGPSGEKIISRSSLH